MAELGMRLGYERLFERLESDSTGVRLSRLKLAPDRCVDAQGYLWPLTSLCRGNLLPS